VHGWGVFAREPIAKNKRIIGHDLGQGRSQHLGG
jgi:hypothetical protein